MTAPAVLVTVPVPPPGADTVHTRLAARRAALTILGADPALHWLSTERLVYLARCALLDTPGGEG
jgi:hypothetical protein